MLSLDVLARFKTEIAICWLAVLFVNFVVEPNTISKFTTPIKRLFSLLLNQLKRAICGNYKGW